MGTRLTTLFPNQRAPDGALEELEEKFQCLCLIWRAKPDGVNVAKAQKAFMAVCADGAEPDAILASAHNWVTKTEPRYLKKLEDWLGNGAWQNEPRKQTGGGRRGKRSAAEAAMAYGEAN